MVSSGSYRFTKLFLRKLIRRKRLPVCELYGSDSCVPHRGSPAGSPRPPIGVLADISRLLCLVQITGTVEAYDLIVAVQVSSASFTSVNTCPFASSSCCRPARPRTRSARFPLVAIEDRELNLTEQRNLAVLDMRVADLPVTSRFPIAFCNWYWLLAAVLLLGCQQVGAIPQRSRSKSSRSVQPAHRSEFRDVVVGRNRFVPQQLAEIGRPCTLARFAAERRFETAASAAGFQQVVFAGVAGL